MRYLFVFDPTIPEIQQALASVPPIIILGNTHVHIITDEFADRLEKLAEQNDSVDHFMRIES